ncbi:MAG: hypothetical protein P8M65_01270 [Roseibacillus sp.]|nr:hypothetical protein [Roseibacillus sp.]
MAIVLSMKRVPDLTLETVSISGQEGNFYIMLIPNEFEDDLLMLKPSG